MLDLPDIPRRIGIAAARLAFVIAAATPGYVLIEHWGWSDALYMTVTTFTTVGGGELTPLSAAGKVWTMAGVLIDFGVFAARLHRIRARRAVRHRGGDPPHPAACCAHA